MTISLTDFIIFNLKQNLNDQYDYIVKIYCR